MGESLSFVAVVPTGSDGVSMRSHCDGSASVARAYTYGDSPRGEAFRALREQLGLTMGDVARLLSTTVPHISGLELGRVTFSHAGDWKRAEQMMRTAACAKHVTRGIYIASKSKHGPRWREMRAAGLPITSTWIDESGEGETSDWVDLWDRCIAEASKAGAFIMYQEPGEVQKGALVELGAALQAGVPVWWVGPEYSTAPRHRLVRRVETIESAIRDALDVVEITLDAWERAEKAASLRGASL